MHEPLKMYIIRTRMGMRGEALRHRGYGILFWTTPRAGGFGAVISGSIAGDEVVGLEK